MHLRINSFRHVVLVLALSASALFAQKPKTQIASHIPPDEARRKSYSSFVWSNNEEFIISDRARGGSVFTIYNGKTMKKTGTFMLDYPEIGGKDADWVRRLFHQDKITSIYGYYDKREDVVKVYGKINDRKNKTIKKETVLMESYAKKKKYVGNLSTIISNDRSKILIFREPAGKKYENEKMEMMLYDNELKKIWSKELSFPYKNRSISVQDILVTNDGKVSIVAYWSPTKEDVRENPSLKDQIIFKLFGVNESSSELDEIEISEKGYALSSCNGIIVDDTTNDIVFTGFYRDIKSKRSNLGVNGIYYFKLNTNNWELDILKFNVIDDKTLTSILVGANTSKKSEKRAKKAVDRGYGLNNLALKSIYVFADGSVKMISQIQYVVEVCTTDPRTNTTRCSYHYHNNQIVEFNLAGDGSLKSTLVVPKQQVMVNAQFYNGHIALIGGTNTYYFYNDNDLNYNAKKVSKRGNNNFFYTFNGRKKSRLCYVTFDNKGKPVKRPMFDHWKQNVFIFPQDYARLNDITIVTWGKIRKGKELVLFKISMDENSKPGKKN